MINRLSYLFNIWVVNLYVAVERDSMIRQNLQLNSTNGNNANLLN